MNDAKTFLQQVRLYDTHINNKIEEVARLKGLALKITASLKQDVVSGGGSHDKVGDSVAKIVDLEREISKAIDDYTLAKDKANSVIEQLEDPYQVRVLHMKYFGIYDPATEKLHYPSWGEIAAEISCSYRHTTRIHGWALQNVAKILEKQEVVL